MDDRRMRLGLARLQAAGNQEYDTRRNGGIRQARELRAWREDPEYEPHNHIGGGLIALIFGAVILAGLIIAAGLWRTFG